MIYELRVYTTFPGQMQNLLTKLETSMLPLWKKHGIQQVGFWTTHIGPDANELTYMLAWESLAEREQKWNTYQSDPEFIKAKENAVEQYGQTNAKIANSFLVPTRFSALQ
ncbi:hypothetical protein FE257_007851 [Aspergillus nanangensis]|uniref:NIPSNAP domain-containing protein n=1 Tax=Aspergillus nanangensis TaxID=2582783 RepID=A0AAD4CYW1_ASPNN|nr:hypothetical protein FE257_007851 [Aspergillus nanangensis]